MAAQEGCSTNRAPLFYETNYALWSIMMQTYIMAHMFDIWKSFLTSYTTPKTPPRDVSRKKLSENNTKAMNAILCGLLESEFVKVMHCESIKQIQDKLQNIYEGDDKFQKSKLQTHRGQFERFKMKNEENVATYPLSVHDIVNTIRGLGEKNDESMIVQKVLR